MKENVTNWKTVLEYAAAPPPAASVKPARPARHARPDAEDWIFVVTLLAVTVGGICSFFWMFR